DPYWHLMSECAARVDFGAPVAPLGASFGPPAVAAVVKVVLDCYPRSPVSVPERVEADIVGSGSGPGGGVQVPASDDADLGAALAGGDAAALGALYDRHAPHMLALAKRIVVTATAAEDIVQDVFLEAWKKARSYDPSRGGVKSWLLLRTRSRAIDFRRA